MNLTLASMTLLFGSAFLATLGSPSALIWLSLSGLFGWAAISE